MNTSQRSDNLTHEAQVFNSQIDERIANGHAPDLRLTRPCDYLYNNYWRGPEFVKFNFVVQFGLIHYVIARLTGRSTLPYIAGLRYGEAANMGIARILKEMDRILVEVGTLPATEFFYFGPKN